MRLGEAKVRVKYIIRKMKNKDLQAELVKRGCSKKGKKDEMIARLIETVDKNIPIIGNKDQADDFYTREEFIGTYWKVLEQDGELITDDAAHA